MSDRAALVRREDLALQLLRANPRRITEWRGCIVDGGAGRWNPYAGYCDARRLRAPRETLMAELLVGDVVARAALLGEFKAVPA